MSGAALIYYYWEAMLISYLSTRVTPIPFITIKGLLDSSYSFNAKPGTNCIKIGLPGKLILCK